MLEDLDPKRGRVCDLFAGSGTVSNYLAYSRPVTAVDIQEYSRVLCSATLEGINSSTSPTEFLSEVRDSKELVFLLEALEPVIQYEDTAMARAMADEPEQLCELMEHGSLVSYQKGYFASNSSDLKEVLKATYRNLERIGYEKGPGALISRHFGGIYFSFKQAVYLDAILSNVNRKNGSERNLFLAPLLSTVSDTVNTVGKQFAQPLQPRDRDGRPKKNLGRAASKDRTIDVFSLYHSWVKRYNDRPAYEFDHKVEKMDFSQALDKSCKDFSVVYADPPYTRDHYSRFYHALETICLGDDPKISTTKIGGRLRLSRGLYRANRHQSPFCIRSQAPAAFESLFSIVSSHGKPLVLSYSPFDGEANAHPRVMTIDALKKLGEKYFREISIRSPGALSHSKLNSTAKHLESSEFGEVLMVFR